MVDPNDPMTVFVNNYVGGVFKSIDGGETWVNWSKGYTGAHLHDIAIDAKNPAIVYTIGRSGPFRSFDGGQNWTGIAFPPANLPEWNAVAISPGNHNEILISGEANGGIYKTTDGGNSWRLVFKHPNTYPEGDCNTIIRGCWHGFKDIVHAPSNPSIVYAGMRRDRSAIDGNYPAAPSYGMYKSTDGGETWTETNNGLKTSLINIECIAVHPNDPNIVYIGTWKDGVFKSINGGQNWVMKNNGLASADVRSLAIDPMNPEIVYAGLGEGSGIYRTTNGGELWSSINSGLSLVCPSVLLPVGGVKQGISLEKTQRMVSGSDYYSVPWTSVWSIVIDPTNSQTIYAADHQSGVYMSIDGGNNWLPIKEGLSMKAVTALAISYDGKVLYAATEGGGVFKVAPGENNPLTVQKVFIGYYQRPAGPSGLIYWANRLSDSGGNLDAIIEAFANAPESWALYGDINSGNIRSVVTTIFQALFDRDPAQAGLDYYENGFNLGLFTPGTIVLNVLNGATGTDLQSVNNKLTAADLFTRTIDPELDGKDFQATYLGDADAQKARNFLSTVNWDPATIPTQAEVTLFIKNNIADPGDPILNP